MRECKMTITMTDQGQIRIEGPPEFELRFLLLAAAHEITLRQFIPPAPSTSGIVVPDMKIPRI